MLAKWGFSLFYCSRSCLVKMKLLALVCNCIMLLPTVSLSCNSSRNGLLRQELFCNAPCSVRTRLKEAQQQEQQKTVGSKSILPLLMQHRLMFCKHGVVIGQKKTNPKYQLWYPASSCNVITIKEGDGSSWRNKSKTSLRHHGNWPLAGTAGSGKISKAFQIKNCCELTFCLLCAGCLLKTWWSQRQFLMVSV